MTSSLKNNSFEICVFDFERIGTIGKQTYRYLMAHFIGFFLR